jgi:two-component system LytT family sensor kinase
MVEPVSLRAGKGYDSLMRPSRDPLRLRPIEVLGIVAGWTFVGALAAIGRVYDPRVPLLRSDVNTALLALSFIEYAIWALLTVPIVWVATRVDATGEYRIRRRVALVILGLGIAIAVDTSLRLIRNEILPSPRAGIGEPVGSTEVGDGLLSFQFLDDFMIYLLVLGTGLTRNYFIRYRDRLGEARRLNEEAADLRAQLAEARLAALRSRLNPHFLFNTLNAVAALVERDPFGVRRMLARLGELLRFSLDESDEQEITVAREVELVRLYLEIMEVRFQGRLETQLLVEESAKHALVPTLLLQPLVENAFKHGVSMIEEAGVVSVEVRREGSDLVLVVTDNGPGPVSPNSEGEGLANTRKRLQELYGDQQQFELRTATPSGGAIAKVRLPFHMAPLAEAEVQPAW